jgi:1-aminocyclopropane-1-carboxylate deaminase/D-cysteine desulfhydrase-like pyridoxal-dependent ACC family enzyme
MLDRVYSGKGMAGTLDHLRRGISVPGRGQAALFIHTGGSVELFA